MDACTVKVADTDISFICSGDEVVLEAMKRAGRGPIRYGCFGGGCGVCKMKILSGRYEIIKKMSRAHVTASEQEAGIALMCCIQPRGDLILARV